MRVAIAKVHESVYAGDADSVTAPTAAGTITVLGNHEPLVAPLLSGVVIVSASGSVREFPVESGVIEVSNNQVTVLL